ncbi:nuclear transport factor 2 family protein [Kineobactrum sediminis]|uniref:Nuclear transport factor 2 family protein n=1 Tax=Kineobactrum sediminis TaxID=1905677 RepID=A0A2N5Y5G1_9GAMM|nr:nuclear transport factor 2 family protein [Kineobactrum sediminis]PLW83633.1 nuclear transport factor 2 family protein [Kineobactrum sediminis]
MPSNSLEARLHELEAREQIRNLVAGYGLAVDDHDLEAIGALFTADASFGSRDGVMCAQGRQAIVSQFIERFRSLGISNHVSHDHFIEREPDDPDRARGTVSAHAELWRNGCAFIAALRYHDRYRLEEGSWRFQSRELHFLYYVPLSDYSQAMGSELRQRAYGDQRPADYPESLPGWRDYQLQQG